MSASRRSTEVRIVLGSRSPRRRELLGHLVDDERIVVRPPSNADEPGFDGLHDWPAIERRLREIVRAKSDDVAARTTEPACVLTADTIIVGERTEGEGPDGELVVLGQPPIGDEWRRIVRSWFVDLLLGRTHTAVTAVRLVRSDVASREAVVRTRVTFGEASTDLVEWYLESQEPVGKAGGYALQGAGSLFVERIEGSPSNVIGLPLRETRELVRELAPETLSHRSA